MASTIVDGIRLAYVRRCRCGRRPEITTCYQGFTPGDGPFVIRCFCDIPLDAKDEHGFRPHPRFCRSWSKSRVVKLWTAMNAEQDQAASI